MIRLNIDGREVTGYKGQTILEAALENDIFIPTLCFDKRLEVYGSCGICVVEMEGNPKLLRACATEIAEGMVIKTDTRRVRESRKVNLELLLSQHTGDCRAPCGTACPAQTDCQGYTGLIANGEFEEALKLIKDRIPLAASLGRVCPHPCEDACRRKLVDEPVSLQNLKRFAADIDLNNPASYIPELAPPTGKRVAVAGGGPGGLSCAFFLAQLGHSVTVFDAMPKMGGMLRYGIPEYRLPKQIVDKEAALVEKMGVEFKNNVRIGKDISLESLKRTYDAVVIAVGAWVSQGLRCPGSELDGVYGGIDFLRRVVANETVSIGKRVAVVGGGNTAMDACRTAVRLGAEQVFNIYRRTKAEMPAEDAELTEAEEEGVIFKYLVNPLELIGDNGKVSKMRLQKMRLGEPDASGRRSPEPIEGEEEIIEVDTVIAALGQGVEPAGFCGLELTKGNTIIADENLFTTSENGVFAIGDCVNKGAAIAVEAIGNAKKAAAAVDGFLSGHEISYRTPYRVTRDDLTESDFAEYKKEPRSRLKHLAPGERRDNFLEMSETYDAESALRDAKRCLECGCHDFFECKLIELANQYGVQPERFRESVPKVEFRDDHPFIVRDPNKCILCGLCVRMCDEIVGSSALGFVDRGFRTVVMPAFGDPLSETTCVSCGQCVSVCPTGALQERITHKKSVPLDTNKTDSICAMCGVGCPARVEALGNMLVKTTPVAGGVMCARGRFGISCIQTGGRITEPMLRKNGVLTPVSWYDACVYTAKKMESLRIRGKKTAVSIGQSYSAEDAFAVTKLAKLLGAEMFSFMNRENGLADVLGVHASPNKLEEVTGSNAVIVFGDMLPRNPVIVHKLRSAVKNGAAVTIVTYNDGDYNLPCSVVKAENTTGFIKQIIKALIDSGNARKNAPGFSELEASLAGVAAGPDAKAVADSYKSAKKAMLMYAVEELTPAGASELANLAVIAGHIGTPRDGIYMLRQGAGSQALSELGVVRTAEAASGSGGLMIFGEDPDSLPEGLEFLMVQDTHMTETAKKADAVFPLSAYTEQDGTYINTEGRIQRTVKAVDAPFESGTAELARKIAGVLEGIIPDTKPGIRTPACAVPGQLRVLPETALFDRLKQTNSLVRAVESVIPQRGIVR